MSSAVRAICRARIDRGSCRTTRSTTHATTGASTTEASAPSRASSSSWPLNAMLEMSSEIVNPTPATAPPAASSGPLSGERGPRSAGRVAIHEPIVIPSGLPTT